MPRMLLVSDCLINHADDRGGVAYPRGEFVEVPKDIAKKLAIAERALYERKEDDHDKTGRYTASERLITAAKKMSKQQAQAKQQQSTPQLSLQNGGGDDADKSTDQDPQS